MEKIGQVWIETVIYTSIAIALIALVLTFVMPNILKSRDKLVVEQAIESLNSLDNTMTDVIQSGPLNVRNYQIQMKQGTLYINSTGNGFNFMITGLSSPYSQSGEPVQIGRITILSQHLSSSNLVYMTLNYTGINITYSNQSAVQEFPPSPTPYVFSISNEGDVNNDGLYSININEVSGG